MDWTPPATEPGTPLRSLEPQGSWRAAVEIIAGRHGLLPCELSPYAKGETIVWRAGEHVIKLTAPDCAALYPVSESDAG